MFYPGETVRLLRDLPAHGLLRHMEGRVNAVPGFIEGSPHVAEIEFYQNGTANTLRLPFDEVELVIEQSLLFRTAVFWGLDAAPTKMVESAIHSVLDRGFLMRDGLNLARLHYDRNERWWKWGEKTVDPTGALVVTSASAWDGFVVALSGPQRFHLEFRMKGRGETVVLLHERDEAYSAQSVETEPAMSLLRVLMDLFESVGARYCAFPVDDTWIECEDWRGLLRAPLYPDFFMLPEADSPTGISEPFRGIRFTENRLVWTTLPLKASPTETAYRRTETELNLDRLRKLKALGEKYYDRMYESGRRATGFYSSAKDAFYDAINLANQMGLKEEAEALSKRLENIKGVFRSQFS